MSVAAVRISDSVVANLLGNANARREFPFMATAWLNHQAGKKVGCNTCGNKTKKNTIDYSGLRRAIGQMSVEQKRKLKQILGARQVEVVYNNGRGKTVRLKF